MAVYESFVNGKVCTHRLEVVRSLIPFAQGQRVVFPESVDTISSWSIPMVCLSAGSVLASLIWAWFRQTDPIAVLITQDLEVGRSSTSRRSMAETCLLVPASGIPFPLEQMVLLFISVLVVFVMCSFIYDNFITDVHSHEEAI